MVITAAPMVRMPAPCMLPLGSRSGQQTEAARHFLKKKGHGIRGRWVAARQSRAHIAGSHACLRCGRRPRAFARHSRARIAGCHMCFCTVQSLFGTYATAQCLLPIAESSAQCYVAIAFRTVAACAQCAFAMAPCIVAFHEPCAQCDCAIGRCFLQCRQCDVFCN